MKKIDKNIISPQKMTFVDGTCIELLTQKTRVTSKTGHKGVGLTKNGKFIAHIGFKRKSYTIGIYDDVNKAIKARQKAEEELFNPMIESFRKEPENVIKRIQEDERRAKAIRTR